MKPLRLLALIFAILLTVLNGGCSTMDSSGSTTSSGSSRGGY